MQSTSTQTEAVPARKTSFRWLVMLLIFLIYTMAAADRANIGIVLPFIRKEFEISNTEAGVLVSLFFLCYSLGQIPAGFLLSKLGVRKVLPFFMIVTSAFTALIGTTGSIMALKIYRAGLGIAEAPLPLSMLATINRWFPKKEKGTATGLFLAAAKMGPVIVPPIGAVIIALYGWRMVFLVCAVPGIVLSLIWLFSVADDPEKSKFTSDAEVEHIKAGQADVATVAGAPPPRSFPRLDRLIRLREVEPIDSTKAIFRSWDIWGCAIGYLLITGIVNVILAWLPTYLMTVKQFSLANIGIVASAPFVGGVLGNLIGGYISDTWMDKRRKPTMLITALSTTVMMIWLVNTPANVVAVGILMLLMGLLLNIGYSSFSVYSMGRVSKETYPLAASLVNAGGQAGGAIAPLATGIILDIYGWTQVFIFMSVCSFIAALVILTIVEPVSKKKA